MIHSQQARSLLHIVPALLLTVFFSFQAAYATEETSDLTAKVAALELGMNGYTIGTKLSADKKKYSSSHMLNDVYEGTYKFSDGELSVVVAQKDDTVLALYQRKEEAGIDQARKMISGLVGLYSDPTAMAHDKLVYWAYNETGKIPEEKYNQSRENAEKLDVLATVKFNSDFSITDETPGEQQKGTIYFIISSDRLSEEFMEKN
jgi:hypothetical protein